MYLLDNLMYIHTLYLFWILTLVEVCFDTYLIFFLVLFTPKKKINSENNMIPSDAPIPLQGLIQVEEVLISRAFPVIQVYFKPTGDQQAYKDHVITLPKDVQLIANALPNLPKDGYIYVNPWLIYG